MTDYPDLALLIDGAWIADREGQDVLDPATGQPLGHLPHATAADLDAALDAARRAFPKWRATSAYERARIMKDAMARVRQQADAIAAIMTREEGKPIAEAKAEVLGAADIIDWYAEEGRRNYGRIIPSRTGTHQVVTQEPVGVAVALTPWNFPALTPARKIGGALASGCTLVLKPAEETPASILAFARALVEAGVPAGVLNIVFGDAATVSTHLIRSPISRKLSFTGSTAIGKQLSHMAVEHGMMRTTLELGGHAPVVVMDDVDVDKAADMSSFIKYRNAGQVCVSPTRFLVQDGIYDRFVARFVEGAEKQKLGSGLEQGVTMGPLAHARRVEAMERIMADTRERGATIAAGGERQGNQGFFFQPTVITDLGEDAMVMNEEPFGPVAPIMRFRDYDDAIRIANGLDYGLAAYAFAGSERRIRDLGRDLAAGMVGVNSFLISTPETPFGGIKDSGHGSEGGTEGLGAYLETKLVVEG